MSRCRRGVWGTEKLIGKLKDFIAKVKAYFDGLTTNTKAEAALLKEMRDGGLHYLERIVEAYDKAATAAVENYQGAETRSEGKAQKDQMKIRETFADEIEHWVKDGKPEGVRFTLGSTGPVLQGLGAIESDIYMEGDKISTILRDHPEMTLAEIKKIPQILEDPALVLKSKTRGGTSNTRLVLLDTAKAKNRRNIVAVLDLRPVEKGFAIDDIQKVSSAYTKTATETRTAEENSRDFLKTSDVLFLDKKRATSLLKTMGFFMPIELHRNGYVGSISYFKQNVNIKGVPFSSVVREGDVQFSIREIKGEDGTNYGKGVYLDSTLLEGLTDAERKEMMRERVKELGGQTITAYDSNGEAVDIRIAAPSEKFRNRNGRKVPVTKDLSTKRNGTKVKQESVVLADELIATSRYDGRKKAGYPHDWLDNNGKNDWQYWTTYIQDKNNTVWEATLNVAESANGVKYLYDIDPIEKVGQSVKSDTSTTSVGQSVKSDTSTTGDIVAQSQTESQAQIRSSTLSDRDVLRIAAQMAKNSESMLDIKKKHPASSLFRAYNSVPAASAEWLYWQYNLCWAECQHQGLAFFLRGSVNRFSVNFFSIEVITASLSFFRTIQVCCVDIEIKTDFTAHIWRTRILKYTKSLSIADQFPGFNIISVLFLTEFLCIFFDKCNSIFDDISRIHSDSTPLEHFFSMPCWEAATLPDCTCVRTMNFNPCAP